MSLYTSPNGETFTFYFFNSLDEFNIYITGESYNFDICFGVNVVQEDSLTFSTTLMYNTTANSNKTTSLFPIKMLQECFALFLFFIFLCFKSFRWPRHTRHSRWWSHWLQATKLRWLLQALPWVRQSLSQELDR